MIRGLKKAHKILDDAYNGKAAVETIDSELAFVQVTGSDARTAVVSQLRKLGRSLNSFGLMQLAAAAAADPFGKVKSMIEDMVEKLEKEAAEEETEHQWCVKETAES